MLALLKGVLNMEKDDERKVSQAGLAACFLCQIRRFQSRRWIEELLTEQMIGYDDLQSLSKE
jgi:hypothetical protein